MEGKKTPAELGYRMPAEWHPHAATQLHWPSNSDTWPAGRLEKVEQVYLEIIRELHLFESILLIAHPSAIGTARKRLDACNLDQTRIHLTAQPVNDVWARDCGPIFICNNRSSRKEFAITDWEYNAWGMKYPPYDDDNRLPMFIADMFGISRFETGMVLEGGSIETNGEGHLLTTESVLLNSNRNPQMNRDEIEGMLHDFLGIDRVTWLPGGLAGDDTDGHIDDLARFLNSDTILTVLAEDPDDVNHEMLRENHSQLQEAKTRSGKSFTIETLPLPETRIDGQTVDGSVHVPASYANFYIANGVVLVPLYDERYDEQALDLFRRYFPDREIRGIECADLVWGQGSIHCITQQLYGLDMNRSNRT